MTIKERRAPSWWPVTLLVLLAACGEGEARSSAAPASPGTPPAGASQPARGADQGEAGMDDVHRHELTMPRIRAWHEAMAQLALAIREDPSLEESMQAGDEDSPAVMIEKIEKNPRAMAALRRAGVSPREYVLTSLAYVLAGFAAAAVEQNPNAEIPADVSRANLEFVRNNKAELERMDQEFKAKYKHLEDDASE